MGWVFFVVGIIGGYVPGNVMGELVYNLSFLVEMLGVLANLMGFTLLGISLRPTGTMPGLVSLLLTLTFR